MTRVTITLKTFLDFETGKNLFQNHKDKYFFSNSSKVTNAKKISDLTICLNLYLNVKNRAITSAYPTEEKTKLKEVIKHYQNVVPKRSFLLRIFSRIHSKVCCGYFMTSYEMLERANWKLDHFDDHPVS